VRGKQDTSYFVHKKNCEESGRRQPNRDVAVEEERRAFNLLADEKAQGGEHPVMSVGGERDESVCLL
jgi:hypothetical protein